MRNIFEEAKNNSPSIIYFDEFDSISMTRDAEDNPLMATVVNQLLTLMDGIDDTKKICAIASTNRVDMIDEAIKRLKGIPCRGKGTSCPDQLARALEEIKKNTK